ncbi:MAG: SH3 domain-containing protein [Chloroflexota bacterium]
MAINRCLVALTLMVGSAVACNAPFVTGSNTPVPPVVATSTAANTSTPKVVIEAPGSGTQAVIKQPITVRVHATDEIGITRVEMRESGRVVVSQPSPDPNPDFTALLQYRPSNTGSITLEVVAYRQSVASAPTTVMVDVVGSVNDLKNPASLDPTLGVAAGAICTVRVSVSGLNLRTGPGTNFRVMTRLNVGDELTVIGRNADSSWYQGKRSTSTGWVSAGYVTTDGDCSKAPETTPSP